MSAVVLRGIGCVFYQMAVVIRGAVVPPHWAALAKRHLGGMNTGACRLFGDDVSCAFGGTDVAARVHQRRDMGRAGFGRQMWIAGAP